MDVGLFMVVVWFGLVFGLICSLRWFALSCYGVFWLGSYFGVLAGFCWFTWDFVWLGLWLPYLVGYAFGDGYCAEVGGFLVLGFSDGFYLSLCVVLICDFPGCFSLVWGWYNIVWFGCFRFWGGGLWMCVSCG